MADLTMWMVRQNVICKNLPAETSVVINEADVIASLSKLRPNKTTGPDCLKACLLKDCAPQLKEFLQGCSCFFWTHVQCRNCGNDQ